MHEARRLGPVLCDSVEGWDGEGGIGVFRIGGTDVYLWPIHVDVW